MHTKRIDQALSALGVDEKTGAITAEIANRRARYGANVLERAKQKSLIMRVLEAFCEPMMLILCFALAVTFGVNLGKLLRTGSADMVECVGIFVAIAISVTVTVIMEGKSVKAFELLFSLSDKTLVKVRRDGEVKIIPQSEAVVGDVIILESGSKVVADGRLIKSEGLLIDESTLTGESAPREKNARAVVKQNAPLADRVNCVYAGTLITAGHGEMLVTAVGNQAEIGGIAGELQNKNKISAPLSEKLSRLSRLVTIIGGVAACLVFIISLSRLIVAGSVTFLSVQEIFIESIVLIVAAVPEGLPTIVAISLSLNVLKLAKENALIKKLVAAETAGCVSVICSDKTGTLTQNKMRVDAMSCAGMGGKIPDAVINNIIINSTVEFVKGGAENGLSGNPTERALLEYALGSQAKRLGEMRDAFTVIGREDFTSDRKYMSTKTHKNGVFCTYYKGSIEKIFALCGMSDRSRVEIERSTSAHAAMARRIIAFAHTEGDRTVFDGFAALSDPVRDDVKQSVATCKRAGIAVKMLTGDNAETALAIALQTGIASSRSEVVLASEIEGLSDAVLVKKLPCIKVIARSTPLVKLRVVRLLMQCGEVVAVTGDGINDAPAIKQADIGIVMGSGSDIAKEAGDIVLLDDSFSTVVKAISFGRNVFNNFRRFIMFQLSVNFTAVITVLASMFLGLKSPFNSLQLLWINIIMDGPPALTLGFEAPSQGLMLDSPKKRSDNLVSKKMLARILIHSVYMSALIALQSIFNFLEIRAEAQAGATFTLFVFLQLFNAFNCRVVGSDSILKGFFNNKPMLGAFLAVSVVQVLITQLGGSLFGTSPLTLVEWLKIVGISSTVMLMSEAIKLVYRLYQGKTRQLGR